MDNQQVRRLIRIGWLAGIVDGEGSIGFPKTPDKKSSHENYTVLVSITNQDPYIIEQAVSVIRDDLGAACWVSPARKDNGCQVIMVWGMKRCKELLRGLAPYLRSKQQEAFTVLDFIESKQSTSRVGTPRGASSFTSEQLALVTANKALKIKRNLRDYTPDPEWPSGEDIVQAA